MNVVGRSCERNTPREEVSPPFQPPPPPPPLRLLLNFAAEEINLPRNLAMTFSYFDIVSWHCTCPGTRVIKGLLIN